MNNSWRLTNKVATTIGTNGCAIRKKPATLTAAEHGGARYLFFFFFSPPPAAPSGFTVVSSTAVLISDTMIGSPDPSSTSHQSSDRSTSSNTCTVGRISRAVPGKGGGGGGEGGWGEVAPGRCFRLP